MDTKEYFKDLDAVAKAEAERLWELRDDLEGVSEATLPMVKQYAITYSLIQDMTNKLSTEGDIDKVLGRLDKMQKMLINYAKLLKLDHVKSKEEDNKFIKFLKKRKK